MNRPAIGRAIGRRIHLLTAVVVLGLVLAGAALAQQSSGSNQANVTILDGKLKLSATTFSPGKLTLVAVNKGTTAHALEIMGAGVAGKRTPTIGSGKTIQLTVTVKSGLYQLWDPVKGSMKKATILTVKGSASSGASPGGSTQTSPTGTSSSGGTVGTTGTITCDHQEVGTDCG